MFSDSFIPREGFRNVWIVHIRKLVHIQMFLHTRFSSLDTGGDSTVANGLSSSSEPQDVVMEEDTARPEGFIRFTVHNFSKLDKTTLSDPIFVRNLPW